MCKYDDDDDDDDDYCDEYDAMKCIMMSCDWNSLFGKILRKFRPNRYAVGFS